MHYFMGFILFLMFLMFSLGGLLHWILLGAVLIVLAPFLVKTGAKRAIKHDLPLAKCVKMVIYISTILAVSIVVIIGRTGISTPLGKLLAIHWEAGRPTDCRLCPDNLFIIICDADKEIHIQSLKELASLQTKCMNQSIEHKDGEDECYSCIKDHSYHLRKHSGDYIIQYDEEDVWFRQSISFKVVKESADAQIVEVQYKDSMKDIRDSLFAYEVRNGNIKALESWIIFTKIIGIALELAVVALVTLVIVGIKALLLLFKSRRHAAKRE